MRGKRFGSVLFALLVCLLVVVGFAREWFRVSSSEDVTRDEVHLNLTLDRGKFQNDAEKAVDKTKRQVSQLKDSLERGTDDVDERGRERLRRQQLNDAL
jgi:hypothetical protein